MTTPDSLPSIYRFADLTLDAARRRVTRQSQLIELKALDFDLLRFLVESAPNVVNADVLAEKVWGRHFVSPENVAQRVMLLRQSLDDDANRPRYIETVRNKGYRLIPVVENAPTETGTAPWGRRGLAAAAALLLTVGVAAAASYWLAGPAQRPRPAPGSVVVLPFENLSPDPEDAYFAAGMQDEIVSQLTKVSGLRVFPLQPGTGAKVSIAEVVRGLNVATVLGGSVRYSEGRVRVTPLLTEAATGESRWSDSYDRDLSDFFAIQRDIALAVAQALKLELSPADRQRVEHVPTIDPQARDLYLRARARNWGSKEVLLAIDEVEQALAHDRRFKEAWFVDSLVRNYAQFVDPEHVDEHRLRGERAAREALELDPEFGEGYLALGWSLASKKDITGAEAAFRTAIRLNVPRAAMGSYAFLQLSAGKFGAVACDIFEEARAAEPQNELYYRALAFAHEGLGEWERANELYESGISLFGSDNPEVSAMLNQRMHWLVGRNELDKARAIGIADPFNAAMLASVDTPGNARTELRRAYDASVAGNPNRRRDTGLWAGYFGDPALAFEAMRAAIDEQSGQTQYVWLPQLAPMRRLPEFKAYLRDIGMVAYWQEYGWPTFCRPIGDHDFECH